MNIRRDLLLLAVTIVGYSCNINKNEVNTLPNIVVILADDMGYGDIEAYNSESGISTPNLNSLCQEGMIFTDAHTNSAVCTPTRYGLLTGRYAWRTRLKNGVLSGYSNHLIDTSRATIASLAKSKGYSTAVIGKWHLGVDFPWQQEDKPKEVNRLMYVPEENAIDYTKRIQNGPNTLGFDYSFIVPGSLDMSPYVFVENDRVTAIPDSISPAVNFPAYRRRGEIAPDFQHKTALDKFTQKALEYINEEAKNDKPFLLYFPLTAPHKPALPAERFNGKSGFGAYGDMVLQVDWTVGQINQALKESGIEKNTIVIYTSDNGSYMYRIDENEPDHLIDEAVQGYHISSREANKKWRGTKTDIYDGGHRIPFIVKWPGKVASGTSSSEIICLTDVFATLADIIGVDLSEDEGPDSFSFKSLLLGEKGFIKHPVVHHSVNGTFSLRHGKWKMIFSDGSGGRQKPSGAPFRKPYRLYDMEEDPIESNDLIDSNVDLAEKMEEYLNQIMNKPELSLVIDKSSGPAALHGLSKLTDILTTKKVSFEEVESLQEAQGKTTLVIGLSNNDSQASRLLETGGKTVPKVAEALTIWNTEWQNRPACIVCAYDDVGLMYALLDLADRVSWSTDNKTPLSHVKEITEKPDVEERAISIYTMNRAYWESRFYDDEYWNRYLDVLAQSRFNNLTLIFGYENGGFLAPCYPYFFNLEEFPEVRMEAISPQEQQKNLDALNSLIQKAHKRGISFTVGFWDHIYRGGVQRGGISDKEEEAGNFQLSRVQGITNENLISYNFSALEKFVKLVPGLDGIQFRMHDESGLKKDEQDQFWLEVFQKMKEIAPDLRFDLRAKGMPESVIKTAIETGVDFRITTKYWMEQMGLPFHPSHINRENQHDRRHGYADMLRYPQEYKMLWRIWTGGTMRVLLWGDPEYVARFAESTHLYDGDGYEVNEPLATKMETQPHDMEPFELLNPKYQYYDYEFERYWHFFQVFGRIGYNPDTDPEVWKKEFELRFGKEAAPIIEEALHKSSKVLPRIVASCYPYGCFPTTRGWAGKQRLGNLPEYADAEGSDIQQFASFDTEAQLLIDREETAKILPSANSRWFEQLSSEIITLIEESEKAIGKYRNKEFNSTITDLRILSNLALYHSRRIPAAVSYKLFERTSDISVLDDAIRYEGAAVEAWRQIVSAAGDVYASDLKMGVRESEFMGIHHQLSGHWKDELVSLEEGLESLVQTRNELGDVAKGTKAPHYRFVPLSSKPVKFDISHHALENSPVNEPILVNVKVSAPSGIKWVKLRYRSVNQKEDYKAIEMKLINDQDAYQAIVPREEINSKWDFMYFIEIMDNNGNGKIYPDLEYETPYVIVKLIR
jgi:arylsulfatase A-like enzyme